MPAAKTVNQQECGRR